MQLIEVNNIDIVESTV